MPPSTDTVRRFSFESATIISLLATIVLALVALMPGSANLTNATKVFVLGAGSIITLACYILARLTRGNVILPPIIPVIALWLPALAYALSMLFSGTSVSLAAYGEALDTDTFGLMLIFAVLGTLTALAVRRIDQYRAFFTWMGYALTLVIGAGVFAVLVGQVAPKSISPSFSLPGSFEDLAAIAGLGIIMILLALRSLSFAPRTRVGIMIVGAGCLLILALANVGLFWILVALVSLALFVEAVMASSSHAMNSQTPDDFDDVVAVSEDASGMDSGRRSLSAPLIVLAVSLLFIIGSSLGSQLSTALKVNFIDVRPSWQSTLATGHAVYKTSPLFGTGPNAFGPAWLASRAPTLNSTVFWNVDFSSGVGSIPTSFVTTGIIGAIAWLLMLGGLLFFGVRGLIKRAPADPFASFSLLAAFVAFVYLTALEIFSVPGPVLGALMFVFAGLFVSALRYTSHSNQWGVVFAKSPRTGFVIVFGLTLLLLGSIAGAYSLIEHYFAAVNLAAADTALGNGDITTANAKATASLTFAPSPAAYQTQALIALAMLRQIANDSTIPAAQAQTQFQSVLSGGINAALTATRLEPNNYQNWLALANLYSAVVPLNVQGAYDNAKQAYAKAQALNPSSPAIPYVMAQLEISAKNQKLAETDLIQSIQLKQDYTQAIFLLSQLEVAMGNVKQALAAAEAAAYFTPNDANILFQVGVLRAASNDTTGAIQALQAAVAANTQFSNARYYLAALLASQKNYTDAITQLEAIGAFSDANKAAVAPMIAQLQAGKDPFPANLFTAPTTPLQTPATK